MRPIWMLVLFACGDNYPRKVVGTSMRHHVTEAGVVDVAVDLTAIPISVFDPATNTTIAGTGHADGTFEIPGVPTGTSYVRVGDQIVVTDADIVDFDLDVFGRADALPLAPSSTMKLTIDGLVPWSAADELQAYVANTGMYGPHVELDGPGGSPAIDATMLVDHVYTAERADPSRRIDAEAGDRVVITQLAGRPQNYRSVAAAGTLPAFSTVDGGSVAASTTLSPQTQIPLATKFNRAAFDAAVGPLLQFESNYSILAVHALADAAARGLYGSSADLLIFEPGYLFETSPIDTAGWLYGDPFPAAWTRIVSAIYDKPHAAGFVNGQQVFAFDGVRSHYDRSMVGATLEPLVGPIIQLTIDNMGWVETIGPTPTLAWQPPLIGTPAYYEVLVIEMQLDLVKRTATRKVVATIRTTATTMTIPAGLLKSGATYIFHVESTTGTTLPLGRAYVETQFMIAR